MAKWVHSDVLDNGISAIKANANKQVLLKAYVPGDSYNTVNGTNKLAEVAMASGDYTLGNGSGSSRTLTTAAGKSATASASSGSSPDLHIAFVDTANSKVLWVTATSNATVTVGDTVNFPVLAYTADQPPGAMSAMSQYVDEVAAGRGATLRSAQQQQILSLVSRGGNPPKQHGIYIFDGRINLANTPDGTSGTTYSAVFQLPCTVDAVEPIFGNGGGSAYTIAAMSAAAVPDDGSDQNGASQTLTVGSVTGRDTVPALVGTAQPGLLVGNRMLLSNPSGYKSVMVRVYLPNTSGAVTMLGSGSDSFTNWASRTDGERVSFRAQVGNQTATAGAFTSTTQVSYCPIIGVKFYARGKYVVTLMLNGDSIDSGRGTYKADGPVRQALRLISRSGYVVTVANLGWAASASATNRGTPAIAFGAGLVPDLLIRAGVSPNDTGGNINDSTTVNAWRQACAEIRAACAAYGVQAAFRTGIPANNTTDTPAGGETWGATDALMQQWNAEMLTWRANGIAVWDWWSAVAGPIGVNGNVTLGAYTDDGTHPNDAGNARIATAMAASGLLP